MRTIRFLIQKEFLQIFRNKSILPIIIVAPVIQLLVLAYAADFEIRNLKIYWNDQDQSTASSRLRDKISSSEYFSLTDVSFEYIDLNEELDKGKTDLILNVPIGFERDYLTSEKSEIQLLVNAIDGIKAGLGSFYLSQVARDFSLEVGGELMAKMPLKKIDLQVIETTYSFWFNPFLNYKTYMVPGILVILVTMIGAFISSMNIVREKELGTIEQLNVTPLKKYQFILGKMIPLWIIGLFEFSLGLLVAKLVFNIPIVGSLLLLYGFTAVYLVMVVGIGMFISTVTETQQQAMFISWFFLVIFILMGGLFTPIENMPPWAQKITLINPVRYFIEVIRLVMLKGSGLQDIGRQIIVVVFYAIIINSLAVWRYRKTT